VQFDSEKADKITRAACACNDDKVIFESPLNWTTRSFIFAKQGESVAGQRINALLHFQERCFGTVRATCTITRRISSRLNYRLASHSPFWGCNQCARTRPRAIQPMLEQRNNRPAAAQQDLLLAFSFCRAVYGLTFRKGRSGMLRPNNEVKPLAAY
jgi:hypothetical protein